MASKRILAFSSSRTGNSGYLETALPVIENFLDSGRYKIAFVPFAAVADHEGYYEKVQEALAPLQHQIVLVNETNAKELLKSADCIMVGGGNTFKLLHDLYSCKVLDLIAERINAGVPYIGWSAGSNILGPAICTTNDMPIVEPESFRSLNSFPFFINPHYYNQPIQGFNGETRDRRLEEFILYNPEEHIIALPEGSSLCLRDYHLTYQENGPAMIFTNVEGKVMKRVVLSATNINHLLGNIV